MVEDLVTRRNACVEPSISTYSIFFWFYWICGFLKLPHLTTYESSYDTVLPTISHSPGITASKMRKRANAQSPSTIHDQPYAIFALLKNVATTATNVKEFLKPDFSISSLDSHKMKGLPCQSPLIVVVIGKILLRSHDSLDTACSTLAAEPYNHVSPDSQDLFCTTLLSV